MKSAYDYLIHKYGSAQAHALKLHDNTWILTSMQQYAEYYHAEKIKEEQSDVR